MLKEVCVFYNLILFILLSLSIISYPLSAISTSNLQLSCFEQTTKLNVYKNDDMTWDYTPTGNPLAAAFSSGSFPLLMNWLQDLLMVYSACFGFFQCFASSCLCIHQLCILFGLSLGRMGEGEEEEVKGQAKVACVWCCGLNKRLWERIESLFEAFVN